MLIVTQGAAILLSDLSALSYAQGLIVAWLSYTVFTMYAGSQGVIITDTLFFTGATVCFVYVIVSDLGGVGTAVETLARGDIALITLTIPVLYVPLGVISAIVIWKRYKPDAIAVR